MGKDNIIKALKWAFPSGAILITATFLLINRCDAEYEKGVNHGVNNMKSINYKLLKKNDSLTEKTMSLKDSVLRLNQVIKITEQNFTPNNTKKDFTNLVFLNESDKYIYVNYNAIDGLGGGGGSPIPPNFYYKTKIHKQSKYKVYYQEYDFRFEVKGDTLKIDEISIPVPFPDKHSSFCECDLN